MTEAQRITFNRLRRKAEVVQADLARHGTASPHDLTEILLLLDLLEALCTPVLLPSEVNGSPV